MRRVAVYYGIVDQPHVRKMHTRPVAYLGGVAVFLGSKATLAALAAVRDGQLHFVERIEP